MLVSTDTTDYIFYAQDTTPLHQWHIVAHEVGHLLRGHAHASALEDAVARVLMPDLPIDLVRRVLGRSVYDDAEEREAELIAYAILRRALRAGAFASADGELARLESVFHTPPHERR